jgi:meiotically up-regulated gene 157 (Mug157) protein
VEDGLLPSDENPADDSACFPYSLSTQILFWHTAQRLALRADQLETRSDFAAAACGARRAIEDNFAVDGPLGAQWAYEVDLAGGRRLYHDANDVPTALAPLWGFCERFDRRWTATMRYAFSDRNPGYCRGPLGGLGSLHTAGTWPLGDIQEWVLKTMLGDEEGSMKVLSRLVSIASSDGLLPETYDPRTGRWLARHWFAWPGALLGALLHSSS